MFMTVSPKKHYCLKLTTGAFNQAEVKMGNIIDTNLKSDNDQKKMDGQGLVLLPVKSTEESSLSSQQGVKSAQHGMHVPMPPGKHDGSKYASEHYNQEKDNSGVLTDVDLKSDVHDNQKKPDNGDGMIVHDKSRKEFVVTCQKTDESKQHVKTVPVSPRKHDGLKSTSDPSNQEKERVGCIMHTDLKSHVHNNQKKLGTEDVMIVRAKNAEEQVVTSQKTDESKQHGKPVVVSPRMYDNLKPDLWHGSCSLSPTKIHGILDRTKVDANQLENKPKLIKAKKCNLMPNKEMCLDVSKKDDGQLHAENPNQQHQHRHPVFCTPDKVSHAKPGRDTSTPKSKVISKCDANVNGTLMVSRSESGTCSSKLHLDEGNKIREAYEAAKEVKLKYHHKILG
jgi:hypothetical protein